MNAPNIAISDDLRRFAEAQANEEGHASADDYVQALLEDARKCKGMAGLITKLDEALVSGPAEPMTREDWDAIEREAIEGLRGESIKP